ncbi:ATP-binding protein [Wenjunlia tyrosinilytica]|uniref:Histidine kinase/HSP90-like ATPase domain-containing protein n=1 Tax=Wenjunlia tyrosinilytica TaxID=1544741 RepID=A0A918DYS1_9ACTN|nr:ATP-binding protein [Wenjunlia tyrosinilytica]GGO88594.1 hypothetical protein GCM10012280_29790 [Wenjunlia tyrosinilytica]
MAVPVMPRSNIDQSLPVCLVGQQRSHEPAWRDLWPDRLTPQALYRGAFLRVDGERPEAAHHARVLVVATLADWGLLRAGLQADAQVCVSELVGNVVRHALRPVHGSADDRLVSVGLRCWPTELFLEVGDHDPRMPCLPAPGAAVPAMADGGRGLVMVKALADGLFCKRADHGGKVVYCRFALARFGLRSGAAGGAACGSA